MGYVRKTPAGSWKACWRDATGRQPSKTFPTKREAAAFLATVETARHTGTYIDPHAGKRMKFGVYAAEWLESHNVELTTRARDLSLLRTHLLPQWANAPLSAIDHSAVQKWVAKLSAHLSPATVTECHRLFSAVLKAAIRDRLIAINAAAGVRLPKKRQQAGDRQTISREAFTAQLLPAIPPRHRPLVALAGGTGLRWGECIGLRWESIDLNAGTLRVERVAIEVSGHVTPKPYPKSRAGRRVVPLPSMVADLLKRHRDLYGTGPAGEVFTNEAGTPLRRTLFRARIWRPALVRAGLLGAVTEEGEKFRATWPTPTGDMSEVFSTAVQAVKAIARHGDGGLRFHDLRHSYASWLITSGVPVPDVQRVMGHERPTTTLAIYTHVQGGSQERVLDALAAFSLPDEG
ncbi:MAG TPA: site-specific integrase [Kribbella sp.]|uniref:tyrosine-type recombinase/integrase n=1 Tax=Kribbella sp. TaxID=1871183 RepID=UPI002D77F717|nr:site-specific integrase [Kribbella sp.]HET6297325.1 site-specific integrase [Kribbella sp.]